MATYNWTIYEDGEYFSASTSDTMTLDGITLPNDKVSRCHSVYWTIVWDDNNGHVASGNIIMSACTEEQPCGCQSLCWDGEEGCIPIGPDDTEYVYVITCEGGQHSGDSANGYSGACYGENETFISTCVNTGQEDLFGTWIIYRYYNNDWYLEYGPSKLTSRRFEYQFPMNETLENQRYMAVYFSECEESAFTYYTVMSNKDCVPCENPQAIDFKLPSYTKWSSLDLNACVLNEGGRYFSWGGQENGELSDKDAYTLTRYSSLPVASAHNATDRLNVLRQYDTANAELGGSWIMPTPYHFEELAQYTTITDHPTMPNMLSVTRTVDGQTIEMVIPKVGGYLHDNSDTSTATPYFWTSMLSGAGYDNSVAVSINGGSYTYSLLPRYYGMMIRPIQQETIGVKVSLTSTTTMQSEGVKAMTFILSPSNGRTEKVTFQIKLNWGNITQAYIGKIYETWSILGVELLEDNGNLITTDVRVDGNFVQGIYISVGTTT